LASNLQLTRIFRRIHHSDVSPHHHFCRLPHTGNGCQSAGKPFPPGKSASAVGKAPRGRQIVEPWRVLHPSIGTTATTASETWDQRRGWRDGIWQPEDGCCGGGIGVSTGQSFCNLINLVCIRRLPCGW
jgi:hypothetical protein